MDKEGHEYGEERIRQFVVNCRTHTPDEIVAEILSDVHKHDPTTPPADDTTIVTIKMTDGDRTLEQQA
jgi:hypothetical protein